MPQFSSIDNANTLDLLPDYIAHADTNTLHGRL